MTRYLRHRKHALYHLLDEDAQDQDRSGYRTLCGDRIHPDEPVYVALYLDTRTPSEPCQACERAQARQEAAGD